MDPATIYGIGGAVSGLAGIGSSIIGANASANQQGSANKWNLLMQMYQNDYNKPVNQMKRLQEAGLNPNLVYGQSATGVAGQAVAGKGYVGRKQEAMRLDADVLGLIGQYQNIRNLEAERERTEQQVALLVAQELESYSRTANNKWQEKLAFENSRQLKMTNDFLEDSFGSKYGGDLVKAFLMAGMNRI